MMGREGKWKIDKCAYILVYEKTMKRPVTFVFDETSIGEKDLILSNIKEDKLEHVVWSKTEDDKEVLKVGFYDLKPFVPAHLATEIKDDNYRFLIEQHVYSKEFLTFLCGITELKDVPDFDPEKLPNRIFTEEVCPKVRAVYGQYLEANFQFLLEVFAKTEDNQVAFALRSASGSSPTTSKRSSRWPTRAPCRCFARGSSPTSSPSCPCSATVPI